MVISRTSSSSSEGEFGGMFATIEPEDEVFVFEDFDIFLSSDYPPSAESTLPFEAPRRLQSSSPSSQWFAIQFHYKVSHLKSSSVTDEEEREEDAQRYSSIWWVDNLALPCVADEEKGRNGKRRMKAATVEIERGLLSVGLCVMCWFWMGFACPTIRISSRLMRRSQFYNQGMTDREEDSEGLKEREKMMKFWKESLHGVLAEFLYVNRTRLNFVEIDIIWGDCESSTVSSTEKTVERVKGERMKENDRKRKVLVPIGGGKDSLVVWHLTQQQRENDAEKPEVSLLYVCDGYNEYDVNQRLQSLISTINLPTNNNTATSDRDRSELVLVKHNFNDDNYNKYSHSYYEPCGHPWAALVLFDAVLVSILMEERDREKERVEVESVEVQETEERVREGVKGRREISLGYEKSADEGNGVYVGDREVNHQYDKSSYFLTIGKNYVNEVLRVEYVNVYSPLMNMWELEVSQCTSICQYCM